MLEVHSTILSSFEARDARALGLAIERLPFDDFKTHATTRHVLGFFCIPLFSTENVAVRLHVWPKGQLRGRTPDWPIHTHRWNIRSYVALGQVTNSTFRIEGCPDGESRLYEVLYNGDGSSERVKTNRTCRVVLNSQKLVRQGEFYDVPVGGFHSTTCSPAQIAVTLVRTGVPVVTAQVIGEATGGLASEVYSYRPRPVTSEDIKDLENAFAMLRRRL